jgi:hypothetical protein
LPEILKQKLNMRSKGRALPGKLGVFRYLSWDQTIPASNVQRQIMHSYSLTKYMCGIKRESRSTLYLSKAEKQNHHSKKRTYCHGWLAATFLILSKF